MLKCGKGSESIEKKTLGQTISILKKEKNMTQSQLAKEMGITDKAISKWERDLSLPDIYSISLLSDIFQVSVDELIKGKNQQSYLKTKKNKELKKTILKSISLALSIAVIVLCILNQLEPKNLIIMLAIGLLSLSINHFDL